MVQACLHCDTCQWQLVITLVVHAIAIILTNYYASTVNQHSTIGSITRLVLGRAPQLEP